MNKEHTHPKHDEIAALVRKGVSDRRTAVEVGVDRRTVVRVRRMLNIAPRGGSLTTEQRMAIYSVPMEDGHTGWSGPSTNNGRPEIRHGNTRMQASHIAFRMAYGRDPVGSVKTQCDMPNCLSPTHLTDMTMRRNIRMLERTLHGLPAQPWDICPERKHNWETYGRLQENLKPYCNGCSTLKTADYRKRTKMQTTEKDTTAPVPHNCTNPPHFPPHCGCPAGVAPASRTAAQ